MGTTANETDWQTLLQTFRDSPMVWTGGVGIGHATISGTPMAAVTFHHHPTGTSARITRPSRVEWADSDGTRTTTTLETGLDALGDLETV